MKKRILCLLVAICAVLSLAGCGSGGNTRIQATAQPSQPAQTTETSGSADNGINFNEEPYTISLYYPVNGQPQPDLQMVFDKVNEEALKKINAKVELKVVNVAQMANTYALAASSGEKSDLIMLLPGARYLTEYVATNMIQPIDDVMDKYGKDIQAGLGNILETARFKGKLYGVPYKDQWVTARGIMLNKNIADKYGIDVNAIKTLADLDPVFEKVHANEPDMQIFFPNGTSYYFLDYDDLGNSFGVLKNGGLDELKVINMYEDPAYIDTVKKVREWYLKGYIPKDYAVSQENPFKMMDTGKLFATGTPVDPEYRPLAENPPKYTIKLTEAVAKTTTYQMFIWAIPTGCQRPDKVIQFLNLPYKEPDVATLLKYGIEGVHYDKMPDGSIDTTKGFATYTQNWPIWGDSAKYPVGSTALKGAAGGDLSKYRQLRAEWDKNTKQSKALGFTFDSQPVKTEIAALNAIAEQYGKILEGGAVDVDKTLKTFNDQLKAAGLQKVIDEKQRQLDEWVKTQK